MPSCVLNMYNSNIFNEKSDFKKFIILWLLQNFKIKYIRKKYIFFKLFYYKIYATNNIIIKIIN